MRNTPSSEAAPRKAYHPRDTQDSVLVQLLREHLDAFVERTRADGGPGLPAFVERQLRAMIDCGDFAQGFMRFECKTCRGPRIVPLSCKTRLCPSCAGRRMSEQACHLVDRVLPWAPYRQWVLTLPWELARAVAFDAQLCGRVFKIFADEVGHWQSERGRAAGLDSPKAGSVLEIQRFADGARLWPHGHLLAPDGVFYETADQRVRFRGLGPPKEADLEIILLRVTERLERLLRRRALAQADDVEPASADQQLLLQCASMAPSDQVVIEGSGDRGKAPQRRRRKRLCVRTAKGLELHAAVQVKASDRAGLERLCRYLARPTLCNDRLIRLDDGRIEFQLKRVWKGGVRSLVFEPQAFIARLAALIPRPRMNMSRFYGVFGASHPWRSRVVPRPPCPERTGQPVAPKRPARMMWAELLKRVFSVDVLRCPYCGGRLWFVAVIFDPTAVQAIVAAVQLADERAEQIRTQTTPRGPPSDP